MATTPDLDQHPDEPEPEECEGDGDELIACGEEEDLEAVATNVSAEALDRVNAVNIGKQKSN